MFRFLSMTAIVSLLAFHAASAADPAAGEKVFAKCKACHTVEEGAKDRVGPNLFNVFGKPVGSNRPDYKYSRSLRKLGEDGQIWTPEFLDAWLKDPKGVISKTKMIFPGLKKEEDRNNVIAYIQQFSN